jgi:hypothetical protein
MSIGLRHQAHRFRSMSQRIGGEDQRIDPVPVERHALRHYQQNEHQGDTQDQHAEPTQPDFEGGWRRLCDEGVGELAERGLSPGAADEQSGAAGYYRGAGKRRVFGFAHFKHRVAVLGRMLLDRIRFPRQQRLIDKEIAAGQQQARDRRR